MHGLCDGREACVELLREKYAELSERGEDRYPKRSDFDSEQVVKIKAYLGPWPRALEAARIKPPRDGDRLERNRAKRVRAKRARIAARREEKLKRGEKASDDAILKLAAEFGFLQSSLICTDKLVFDASFRPYCEEDVCGLYGKNHTCPPICGTPQEMEDKVRAYKKALVVRTAWHIEDLSVEALIDEARDKHNSAMMKLTERLRADGHDGLMIGAGACTLCRPCRAVLGKPCAFPNWRYSCMAAYCIHVKRLAEECNMVYDYKDGILPFFGLYAFN